MTFRVTLLILLIAPLAGSVAAQKANEKRISIAVLSMNDSELGRRVSEFHRKNFKTADLEVLDPQS